MIANCTMEAEGGVLEDYYRRRIELLEKSIVDKTHNLSRLSAQRNALNSQGMAESVYVCVSM